MPRSAISAREDISFAELFGLMSPLAEGSGAVLRDEGFSRLPSSLRHQDNLPELLPIFQPLNHLNPVF